MEEIDVHTSKNYKIFFSNVRDKLQNLIDEYGIKDIYLITDKNVYNLYANEFSYFKGIKGLYIINPGEENKNKDTVFDIYNDMLSKDCNRKTSIVSLGGGVVGDIAGFVASTFMRGLKFINIPTTLMAQCDSSVGGKNGFDFNGYKNIIGTFYQPEFVFVDTNFIHTISCQDYKNGLAEIIKYGFIYDDTFFDYIDANKEQIKKRNEDVISTMVYKSLKIKSDIVCMDEHDNGIRQILNFGHTIGHGIESASNFSIKHGEAVAAGMLIESYLSLKCSLLSTHEFKRLLDIINYFEMPTYFDDMNEKSIMKSMLKDKKRNDSKINFILPERIGSAIITDKLSQNTVEDILIKWVGKKLW